MGESCVDGSCFRRVFVAEFDKNHCGKSDGNRIGSEQRQRERWAFNTAKERGWRLVSCNRVSP